MVIVGVANRETVILTIEVIPKNQSLRENA